MNCEDRNYYNDYRTNARPAGVPCIDERELPWKWGVCPTCGGRGSYVNPSIDASGISPEEDGALSFLLKTR